MYQFGEFRLDPSVAALRHAGDLIPLTPKVLQTLRILLERRDRVVSKEEFHQELWPGIFIEENALAQNIYLLRKALKERDPDHDYVENVPRLGYRFRGEVRISSDRPRRLRMLAAAGMLCVLTVVMVLESRTAPDRGTTNQEAYELYLLGRAIWMKRDSARMPQAFNHLRGAVDRDPKFAQAWAALADWHAFELSPALEARKAAEWALVLNPDLAEPYSTMGFISMIHDWDWPAAERHFRKSLEMNPNYLTGRQWFALYLTLSRRFGEAEAQLREALQQDPLSINLLHQRCVLLYHSRQYASAERECSKVLEIDPVFRFARESLIRIHSRLGNYAWIADHLGGDTASRDYHAPADSPSRLAFQKDGSAAMWRVLVKQTQASGQNYLGLAGYYTELGEKDKAIDSLARAVEEHEFRMVYACSDPLFDPLRGHSRFDAVMKKVCGSQRR